MAVEAQITWFRKERAIFSLGLSSPLLLSHLRGDYKHSYLETRNLCIHMVGTLNVLGSKRPVWMN